MATQSKSIFRSKTFWINALSAVAAYGGLLPASPATLYGILGANIALRAITKGPVTVLQDAATEP